MVNELCVYSYLQWDTAGQERFRNITTSYYRHSQGILLVYDITDETTFDSVRSWMNQIQMHADVGVSTILVGNKCDLEHQRVSAVVGSDTFSAQIVYRK